MRTFKRFVYELTEIDTAWCDLCGKRAEVPEYTWAVRAPAFSGIQVEGHRGTRDPKNHAVFDICPDCFFDRIVPWLEEQGAQPHWENWPEPENIS